MKREELIKKTDAVITDTKEALETVYNALNKGQQKKIVKEEAVKTLFDRYGVEYGGDE
jgi:hypothetical protein